MVQGMSLLQMKDFRVVCKSGITAKCTVPFSSILRFLNDSYDLLHCTALHCNALHCTVVYSTLLYCTALHCTVLYYTPL
jgi:hypothetical protein